MPFNMAVAGVGGRVFILADISLEDLSSTYNVESEVASQFPSNAPTIAGDRVQLTVQAVDVIAAVFNGYAIDADGLHDLAVFQLNLIVGCLLQGRGGAGGAGGDGEWDENIPGDISTPGGAGQTGGTAIRMGCETNILGTGTISRGYGAGGGGGGGATSVLNSPGGGGGGGGAPLGVGGSGGEDKNLNGEDGVDGTTADKINNGTGGAAGDAAAGAGGDGGDSGGGAQAGSAGVKAGGAAGLDGNAIDSQGFTNTISGSITVIGPVI